MNKKHGHTCKGKSATYIVWQDIKDRCYNKKNKKYIHYGGRGIKICKRWKNSFINFLEDMGEKPNRLSIERINNNKGYSLNNCRWATYAEQNRNLSRNRKITLNRETKCLIDWVNETDLKYNTVLCRILRGWDVKRALTTNVKK